MKGQPLFPQDAILNLLCYRAEQDFGSLDDLTALNKTVVKPKLFLQPVNHADSIWCVFLLTVRMQLLPAFC